MRRERKAKSTQKAMRSRRVILNDSPNSNTRAGTYCGKTAPVPMRDSHSWRNPGGPIGPPAGDKVAGYAAAKPDNARKYADPHGRAGRNVRRQHPCAGNKHATKGPAKHQHSRQGAIRNASLQQAAVVTGLEAGASWVAGLPAQVPGFGFAAVVVGLMSQFGALGPVAGDALACL